MEATVTTAFKAHMAGNCTLFTPLKDHEDYFRSGTKEGFWSFEDKQWCTPLLNSIPLNAIPLTVSLNKSIAIPGHQVIPIKHCCLN